MAENALYVGDNLSILRRSISDDAIDLIYLDPPFNSHATYSVPHAKRHGTPSTSRVTAFEDTWKWDAASAHALRDVLRQGGRPAEALRAFRTLLGESDMLAYLAMMAPRLIELHRVLKPTGSLYLHCDPTASHYLKVLLDAIFGPRRLQNEIIWSYQRYTARSSRFQRLHDVLLFYTRGEVATFNAPREAYGPHSGTADAHYKQDADGRWYRWQKRRGQEPYKIYLAEGRRLGDVWSIPHLNASAKERLGYPTQKPEALLARIITASSNAGDVVLDPFCGSGTAIAAAQKLERRWIGIDSTHLAIGLVKTRLRATFGPEIAQAYTIIGGPAGCHATTQRHATACGRSSSG